MQPTQFILLTAVLWGGSASAGYFYMPRPDPWFGCCLLCFLSGFIGYFCGRDSNR